MRAKLGAEIIGTFRLVLEPLWLFWVTPIIGALVSGFLYRTSFEGNRSESPVTSS